MEKLILNETEIKIDDFGRYSLTDLWKASGLGKEKKPVHFLKNGKTIELVEFLRVENSTFEPAVTTKGRYHGGTWGVRQLVYAYAMWVDVSFLVRVVDVFHSAVNGRGDSAVAIAKGDFDLQEIVNKRDELILKASTQAERDEVERLTCMISQKVSPAARQLQMVRGKGKKYAQDELNRINELVQIDMFNGQLKG